MTRIRSIGPSLLAIATAVLVLGGLPAQGEELPPPGDIHARVTAQEVTMQGWPGDTTLTVSVPGDSFTRTTSPQGQASVQDVSLRPGDVITVEVMDGAFAGLSNTMTVGPIEITSVDYANDLVHGIALRSVDDPAWEQTLVQVCTATWTNSQQVSGGCRWVLTDETTAAAEFGSSTSAWTADFSEPAPSPGGGTEPVVDLLPYWSGLEAGQVAVPLGAVENRTLVSPAQYPYIDVQFRSDWDPPASGDAVALGFDEGTNVHFTLSDGSQQLCTQDATVMPAGDDGTGWYREHPYARFDVGVDGCNPSPGDLLVAEGAFLGSPLTKELTIVTPRTSTGEVGVDANVDTDMLSGSVPAGFDVEVGSWDGSTLQVLVPPGVEEFMADMTQAEPPFDVQPWSWFGIQVIDPDGDVVDTQLRTTEVTFAVVPDHDLVDGQTVTLNGENFTPGELTVMQGYGFIGGLDEATVTTIATAPDGGFSSPYQVEQFITVPTGPEHDQFMTVDCGAPPDEGASCFIAVFNDRDWADTVTHFQPAEVTLTLNRTGTLTKASGRVTVSGGITCSIPELVQITGTLSQRIGRKSLATGTFTIQASCTAGTWSASVTPSGTIPFGTGSAELRATASLMVEGSDVSSTPPPQIITIKAAKK